MLHGAELAGGGRPASLLARRPTRTAAVAGKGTSSPCEHQLAWAGLAKASSRHRALRSPTPSFPPFPFVTGGATVAAFLHSELAPRPLPFHVPSPTFACVPLARAWRAAQRQAERRRRHGPPRRVSANAPRAACAFAVFGCRWRRTSHPRCPRRRADAARPPSPSPSTRQGRQQQEQQQHAAGELPHCGPRAGADSGGCSQQPGGRCGAARCHSGRCRLACLASARLVDAAADRPSHCGPWARSGSSGLSQRPNRRCGASRCRKAPQWRASPRCRPPRRRWSDRPCWVSSTCKARSTQTDKPTNRRADEPHQRH